MNQESTLISVIIPCYNVSAYVERAIHSILSQSYKNLEIWVIDDASNDDTLQKINAIKDDRIKVVAFKENTKKVGAVNEVLQKVNGDLIAFQDADDWSECGRLQEQLNKFQSDPELGICFTNYRFIGNRIFHPGKISLTDEELKNEFLNYTYKRDPGTSPTNCPTMMISREALQKTKGYHLYFAGRVAEDIQWIYRILKDFKGITLDKPLYNYAIREGSFTQIQATGINPKYAYSWQLLSRIIYKDVHEGIDVLAPENKNILTKLELESCEDALIENIQLLNHTRDVYERSMSFKLGKFILTPWKVIKNLKN
jgi:glycosyltransferase involved in cell wall biosynthesis